MVSYQNCLITETLIELCINTFFSLEFDTHFIPVNRIHFSSFVKTKKHRILFVLDLKRQPKKVLAHANPF